MLAEKREKFRVSAGARVITASSPVKALSAGFGAILVLTLGIIGLEIRSNYSDEIRTHERLALNSANKLLLYADGIVNQSLIGIRSIGRNPRSSIIEIPGDRSALYEKIRGADQISPGIIGFGVTDRDGILHMTSNAPEELKIDVSDRGYFKALRDDPQIGYVIYPPIVGRATGLNMITIAHRITGADGAFGGVIAALVDPAIFERFMGALLTESSALVDRQGQFITRIVPGQSGNPGMSLSAAGRLLMEAAAANEGIFHTRSQVDGIDRIAGFKVSADHGYIVTASFFRDTALAKWHADLRRTLVLAGALILVYLAFAAFAIQRVRVIENLTEAAISARNEAEIARAVAEDADRSKSQFLAHMSHELRTPLNAIIGFGEIMSGAMFGPHAQPKYQEYSRSILLSGNHLLRIVDRILDIAKVAAGKWEMADENVPLARIFSEAEILLGGRARAAGVRLDFDRAAGDLTLRADPRILLHIVLNLASNAVAACAAGGHVRVGARVNDAGGMELRIADDGAGMTPEEVERAFEPFESSAHVSRSPSAGTGLGLLLCRKFADLQDATLAISSARGQGTTVVVEFAPARNLSKTIAG
jgi:signal transduction histidine kinase